MTIFDEFFIILISGIIFVTIATIKFSRSKKKLLWVYTFDEI